MEDKVKERVTALIINRTIGTGIATTATVLFFTKSEPLSLWLWALGGVYSFLRYEKGWTIVVIQSNRRK